ncbi:MAG TPA: GWxTD domain-containing protein [Thermoanaerobaculia bacterium]|nr:GWxTD domain-containing protein [Thermoanaerobaculia bacterium]
MKIRKILSAAAVIAVVAVSGYALTPEHQEFGTGPAQFLMTKDEAARWKSISSDADAQAFIDLFWAKRDPSPGTPRNEYREQFDARVKYADEHFAQTRRKGSVTDRGRVFVLFGPPTHLEKAGMGGENGPGFNDIGNRPQEEQPKYIFVYEGAAAQESFGTSNRVTIPFVDKFNTNEFTLERGAGSIAKDADRAIQRALVSPALTEAPKYGAAAPRPAAAAPAAVAAAPASNAPLTDFRTPAYKTAVSDFSAAKTNPYAAKPLFATWGEYVTPSGEYFVPVSLYMPASAGVAAGDLTFFGVVSDESGKPVAVYEEPAKVEVTPTTNEGNRLTPGVHFDKSLTLPAGKYKATFGLASAGTPVSMVTTDLNLSGSIDQAAEGISQLILSNDIHPLPQAQLATDPFAFGGIKVVPKSDRTFTPNDDLWVFLELRNPGKSETNVPKVQMKMDLEGTDMAGKKVKMSSPPAEVETTELKGVPGHYGIGQSIPLASFKPGNYTMTVKVNDTVNKQSYTASQAFKIVDAK